MVFIVFIVVDVVERGLIGGSSGICVILTSLALQFVTFERAVEKALTVRRRICGMCGYEAPPGLPRFYGEGED